MRGLDQTGVAADGQPRSIAPSTTRLRFHRCRMAWSRADDQLLRGPADGRDHFWPAAYQNGVTPKRATVGPVRRTSKAARILLITVITLATVLGCGPEPGPAQSATPSTRAGDLAATRVSTDAMMAHLRSLQQIADANDGNRATGTPGYQASVDYIANALRSHGFDVQTPEFDLRLPFARVHHRHATRRCHRRKPLWRNGCTLVASRRAQSQRR